MFPLILYNDKESSTLKLLRIKEKTQMNFNTILYRLVIDPSYFINRFIEPIKTEYGFIYDVES